MGRHWHSRKEIEKNPELRNKDYETTLHACKRFLRSPSTIFSYAEGTRYTEEKYKLQKPIYKNLLNPKPGFWIYVDTNGWVVSKNKLEF